MPSLDDGAPDYANIRFDALVSLLIEKGVITAGEYKAAIEKTYTKELITPEGD
jgi:hypothetical protein